MSRMKFLFAGIMEKPWMSGWQRMRALAQLGHEIVPVSLAATHRQDHWDSLKRRLLGFDAYERTLARKAERASAEVLQAALDQRPDVAWLEWPRLITPETIRAIKRRLPSCRVISFQNDNPFAARKFAFHGWRRFFDAVPYYDLHLVKRASDIENYTARGARKVELFTDGYSEELFFPEAAVRNAGPFPLVFIGTSLDYRIGVLDRLTGPLGLEIHIFGARWKRTRLVWNRRRLLHPPATGAYYRRIVCGSKIALGFVSHSNRDEWTMRTFEVPACGTFFLAERTQAHQALYDEGQEAEFFASPEECRDKVVYYLQHDAHRERIAAAGRERCLRSGYGLRSRMAQTVERLLVA